MFFSIKVLSKTFPGNFVSSSSNRISMACNKAMSPFIFTGRNRSVNVLSIPFDFAFCNAVSIRGAFVPGFCPIIMITSASSKSSSFTEPLPIPKDSPSATPLLSWHMLLQSGKLFVPYARTKS